MVSGWGRSLAVLAALTALAACASGESQDETPVEESHRISPPPIPPATVPPGTFDRDKASAELAASKAARARGDIATARARAEQSLARWPVDTGAWAELLSVCQIQNDSDCTRYATFFQGKVEFVSTLPPRVAMLGFQNIAEGPSSPERSSARGAGLTKSSSSQHYDRPTLEMARRLEAFYNLAEQAEEQAASQRDRHTEQSFLERNPAAPVVGVGILGVVGAGAWLVAK